MKQAPEVNELNYLGQQLPDPILTVGIEYNSHPKHGFLRIFIDAEQGVGMEDCTKVSHQVSGVLDVEDPIAGEYNLEVSSPGMDRPLFKLKQFEQFIGHTAQVNLFKPVGGRRKITGVIEKVEDNSVYLQQDGQVYKVPFQAMAKAKLEPDYSI
ncbi:ribosome maturation factor RimP [Bathymodiolus platifrons methanotrophic gill symbiont]|uniref:ribosome maturation factor RimP n=1 Tax=Bathymodiolus platifrons methanotrophic gill symbiont TaxID=113268 RepID=UPI000B411C91|nr:ribosome maturation factor RimP [Bathymodiolus platifrons methanotrophic gill symbiont]GAW85335.1 ribosome maturation factor RimP [Bathymodiolus platifrons methanotrophic gill symbiont]